MMKVAVALGATALLLAACGQSEPTPVGETEGPIVAAPEGPMNPAVDAMSTGQNEALTPGASSFTSVQAREAIEKAGYTNVGELSQDAQGVWSAPATREGAQHTVAVDYKGVVTTR